MASMHKEAKIMSFLSLSVEPEPPLDNRAVDPLPQPVARRMPLVLDIALNTLGLAAFMVVMLGMLGLAIGLTSLIG